MAMQLCSLLLLLLPCLGLLSLLKTSLSFLTWLYTTFLRPTKNLKQTYGSWAVITGATDGIGKATAFQLAQTGLNLILIGRNPTKLHQISTQITSTTTISIKTVILDFSGDLSGGIRRLEEAIKGEDVGILVNCAGATYPGAMYFHEVEEAVWEDVVRVNVTGTTMVTLAVVKEMVGRRRRGAVVSVGSGASVVVPSFPLYAVYAATKAYIDQLSRSLYVEYNNMGIDVQCQIPLYVATKMVPFMKSSTFIPSPDDYAVASIRWIGNEPRCTPYWLHSMQWYFSSLVPDFILNAWRLRVGITRRLHAKHFVDKGM